MINFYFTFGRNPEYPFGFDDYVKVTAPDLGEAVWTFQQHHPNRPGSNLVNCAFWYTEAEFEKMRDKYYHGKEPAEVLTWQG